ncbi:hypothetical protein [Brevundimonas sp. R86498]|uniref:hypothetical protein n=1 Tax=Brevundimonas sp. R86498 TaxID=3093845 RepID=UPI0037CC1925
MLNNRTEKGPDRRPAILVCSYDPHDPAGLAAGDADGQPSDSGSARTLTVGADDPGALADLISHKLAKAECQAVLLVGRTRRSDGFRVQMRAENRGLTGPAKWSDTAPALARTTAPVSEMVQALNEAGLAAAATSDSEEDAGSHLLYRILTALPDDADAPAVALLRVPLALEPSEARRGVAVAADAIARHLPLMPRERLG